MLEVKNCCCCMSLRTGTITFGVLSLIGSLISLIFSIFVVIVINQSENSNGNIDNVLDQLSVAVGTVLFVIVIVISIIRTLFCILLTCGALQRNTCILMTWVVLLWIEVIFACIGSILVPFESSSETKDKVVGVVVCVVDAALTAYQLLVVHSYRKQIIREKYGALLV